MFTQIRQNLVDGFDGTGVQVDARVPSKIPFSTYSLTMESLQGESYMTLLEVLFYNTNLVQLYSVIDIFVDNFTWDGGYTIQNMKTNYSPEMKAFRASIIIRLVMEI